MRESRSRGFDSGIGCRLERKLKRNLYFPRSLLTRITKSGDGWPLDHLRDKAFVAGIVRIPD